jgi:hypothetical protein
MLPVVQTRTLKRQFAFASAPHLFDRPSSGIGKHQGPEVIDGGDRLKGRVDTRATGYDRAGKRPTRKTGQPKRDQDERRAEQVPSIGSCVDGRHPILVLEALTAGVRSSVPDSFCCLANHRGDNRRSFARESGLETELRPPARASQQILDQRYARGGVPRCAERTTTWCVLLPGPWWHRDRVWSTIANWQAWEPRSSRRASAPSNGNRAHRWADLSVD